MKSILTRVFLIFVFISLLLTCHAQSFYWTGNVNIDNCAANPIYMTISGLPAAPLALCPGFGLESISIRGSGRYAQDLQLTVYAPSTPGVIITDRNGFGNSYGARDAITNDWVSYACFDMRAPTSIVGTTDVPMEGPYIPENSFDLINNTVTDPNGTWVFNAYAPPGYCFYSWVLVEIVITFGNCTVPSALSCANLVLPIELISFTGESQHQYNLLEWSTASEINNDYFVLENSNDGITFKELSIIDGAGHSNSIIKYKFHHQFPTNIEYYRLKQVDFDGRFEYFNTVAVTSNNDYDLVIFPNPSNGQLLFNSTTYGTYTITYTSVLGNIQKEIINISPGINSLSHFSSLKSGIYIIQIVNNDKILTTQKVIKR